MDTAELEAAVKAKVITPEVARQLRNFSAEQHGASIADDERFGMVGGLADVMTAIGMVLLLGASTAVCFLFGPPGMFAVAAGAWMLAEYFTARRRLTLTSFILFGFFSLAVAMTMLGLWMWVERPAALALRPDTAAPAMGILIAGGATLSSLLFWLRFRFPIAFAAMVIAGINVAVHLMRIVAPEAPAGFVGILLLALGLLLFALAMWWDMSDIRRETRRADVGFWLHCAAGFQIAGASYRLLLGVQGNAAGWERLYTFATQAPTGATALATLALLCLFSVVALVIDRRSLLLSSLAFVFPASTYLAGGGSVAGAIATAILLGGLLVLLAAFWGSLRAMLLPIVPEAIRAQVPRTELTHSRLRPVT